MRMTRDSVQRLLDNIDTITDAIAELEGAGQEWLDLQDEARDADTNESIRDARETFTEALESLKNMGVTI